MIYLGVLGSSFYLSHKDIASYVILRARGPREDYLFEVLQDNLAQVNDIIYFQKVQCHVISIVGDMMEVRVANSNSGACIIIDTFSFDL